MLLSKKKRINYLRSVWGKQLDKHRNLELISNYNNLLKQHKDDLFVDNKTWDNLNFDSIFAKMDRNISGIGQQYLFHLLHKYEREEKVLRKRYELISLVKTNTKLRENIQLNLFNMNGISSYFIPYLLLNKTLPNTKFYPLFYLCSASSFLSILLIPFNGIFLFVALAVMLLNLILNKTFAGKIYEYFTGFSGLNSLIVSALCIGKINSEVQIDEIRFLHENRSLLKSLKKKLGYLVIDKESLNDLALIAIEYLNMFMLFDIIAYYRSVDVLLKK